MTDTPTQAGFEIDGHEYPVPPLDSFTMDEAQVLYDYCGVALEDFAPAHPEATDDDRKAHDERLLEKVRNPGFMRALLHVALQRSNPALGQAAVRDRVGQANALGATAWLLGATSTEDPTKDSQKPPSQDSDTRTPSRPSGSGSPSPTGSDVLVVHPVPTGTGGLDTSFPVSDHMTLVT